MKRFLLALFIPVISLSSYAQKCLPDPKMSDPELEQALIKAYNKTAKVNPADFKGEAKAVSIPLVSTSIVRNSFGIIQQKVVIGIIAYSDNGKCYMSWQHFAAEWEGDKFGEWYTKGKVNGHKVETIDCGCLNKSAAPAAQN